MEGLKRLNKLLNESKNIVKIQEKEVNKGMSKIEDPKQKALLGNLLLRAKQGKLTSEQLINEINGYKS